MKICSWYVLLRSSWGVYLQRELWVCIQKKKGVIFPGRDWKGKKQRRICLTKQRKTTFLTWKCSEQHVLILIYLWVKRKLCLLCRFDDRSMGVNLRVDSILLFQYCLFFFFFCNTNTKHPVRINITPQYLWVSAWPCLTYF